MLGQRESQIYIGNPHANLSLRLLFLEPMRRSRESLNLSQIQERIPIARQVQTLLDTKSTLSADVLGVLESSLLKSWIGLNNCCWVSISMCVEQNGNAVLVPAGIKSSK